MGGKLVFTAVSRWNYKSRQPSPLCRGPATAATLCVGLTSFQVRRRAIWAFSPHLPSPYSYIHQSDGHPSTYRRDRLACLFQSAANAAVEVRPATGRSFCLFSPQQPLWLLHRPSPLKLHYDGYHGSTALSVLNQR